MIHKKNDPSQRKAMHGSEKKEIMHSRRQHESRK